MFTTLDAVAVVPVAVAAAVVPILARAVQLILVRAIRFRIATVAGLLERATVIVHVVHRAAAFPARVRYAMTRTLAALFERMPHSGLLCVRGSVVAVLTMGILFCVTKVSGEQGANDSEVNKYEVKLILPSDREFDSAAERAVPGWGTLIQKLKPFVAIVSNRSDRRIVGFTVTFEIARPGAKPTRENTVFVYPDGLVPTGVRDKDPTLRAIEPLGNRVIPMSFQLPAFDQRYEATIRQWAEIAHDGDTSATLIGISLDCVIFDDGHLAGPDNANLRDRFLLSLDTRQRLYREIVNAVDKGRTSTEAFAGVAARQQSGTAGDLVKVSLPDVEVKFISDRALQDTLRMREQYGDLGALEAFRKSILEAPFTIAR
jgi:hypothetical protein